MRTDGENKVPKGFSTTDVPLEFCLLQGEIAEAFGALRKGREVVGAELADVEGIGWGCYQTTDAALPLSAASWPGRR